MARHWNLKRIVAQTTAENRPMIAVFEKFRFSIKRNPVDSTINGVKDLT